MSLISRELYKSIVKRYNSVIQNNNSILESAVNSNKVIVKNDQWGGMGAYSAVNIKSGDIIETGIVRILNDIDGNENPHVFTWSDEYPCTKWAIASGCATFYNNGNYKEANTYMERNFKDNTFIIIAKKNIPTGTEMLHEYKSKKWRNCFSELD